VQYERLGFCLRDGAFHFRVCRQSPILEPKGFDCLFQLQRRNCRRGTPYRAAAVPCGPKVDRRCVFTVRAEEICGPQDSGPTRARFFGGAFVAIEPGCLDSGPPDIRSWEFLNFRFAKSIDPEGLCFALLTGEGTCSCRPPGLKSLQKRLQRARVALNLGRHKFRLPGLCITTLFGPSPRHRPIGLRLPLLQFRRFS